MTPTTRLPLVERLRLLASPAAENWPDYVRINSMVADGLEAAALIEKQGCQLDLQESALSFVRRWAIEKEGNGTSAEERLSVIANHPGINLAAKTLGERE